MMTQISFQRQQSWSRISAQVKREYRSLPHTERDWIGDALQRLKCDQDALDRLFRAASGAQICAACEGACCAKGHNHLGLPNLLAYLEQGDEPPVPDFSQTCPYLGPRGCLLGSRRRPYACISFLCGRLEERLEAEQVAEFCRLYRQLRANYQAFAERYSGGGMSGLLLQYARLAGQPLLARRSASAQEQP